MLPLILVAVGAYLIGDSVLEDKKYAKGGKTQGYDDKEDERLAMEHGKMAKKDLDSTHARRDDARFEERGKMEHGGMAEKNKYTIAEAKKMLDAEKSKNEGFSWFVPDVDYEGDDYDQEHGVHLSDKGLLDLADEIYKKGGELTDKQTIAKLKKKFANKELDDDLKIEGYDVEIFDWKEEDEKDKYIKKHSKNNYLVPYSSDDDNFYVIVVPKDKMAKGGMLEHGMKQGDKIKGSFDNVVIVENGGKIFVVNLNTGKRWSESAWVSANHGNDGMLAKMKDGGYMAKGGKLVGKQKNLDVNKNGKLDAEDFKMLRKGK
jgi:hypothetical protein